MGVIPISLPIRRDIELKNHICDSFCRKIRFRKTGKLLIQLLVDQFVLLLNHFKQKQLFGLIKEIKGSLGDMDSLYDFIHCGAANAELRHAGCRFFFQALFC